MDNIYIVYENTELLGCYDNYKIMDIQLKGMIQKKIINSNIKINIYNKNSFNCIDIVDYVYKPNIKTESINKNIGNDNYNKESTDKNKCDDKAHNNLIEHKQKLTNLHNLVTYEKGLLEEKKLIYENDIKIYTSFIQKKDEDNSFIIPELFVKKFNIIKELYANNTLSFNSFYSKYYKPYNIELLQAV